jgi:hypothetical protein
LPIIEPRVAAGPRPGTNGAVSPEVRALLLTSAGPEVDEEVRALLSGKIDEALLLRLALRERAEAALQSRMSDLGIDPGAGEFRDLLRRHVMISAFRQQHLHARLQDAVALLHEAGFRVMLLKGAALGTTVYQSFGDRPMGDADLLLPAAEARPAFELLRARGWCLESPPEQAAFYDGHHHLPPLCDPDQRSAVLEVHTNLFQDWHPFRIPLDEVWQGAQSAHLGATEVWVPGPHHALLHVCTHFAWSHVARKGSWRAFRDLRALLAHGALDWPSFCRDARQARAVTCCYWTLRLAAQFARLPVPETVWPDLRPPGSEALRNRLEAHLAVNVLPGNNACPSVRVWKVAWEMAIRPQWSGHGAVRPWDAPFRLVGGGSRPDGMARTICSHARRLGAWRRYASAVLTG